MKLSKKIVYGIAGLLAFLPLSILVIFQSIFALEASYDSKVVIDANKITINDITVYDTYGNTLDSVFEDIDEDGKLILWSIIEATNEYMILDLHGGKIDGEQVDILGIQFGQTNGGNSKILSGVVYIQFKHVAMLNTDTNYSRDFWIRDFIEDINTEYRANYEKPMGTISYVWVKIITASLGTILGIITVAFVVLRKSTKALVKRYWRIAVLVALIEGTMVLGLITWLVTDIFQVFAAATVGWLIFLGSEKFALWKGYLDTPQVDTALDAEIKASVENDVAAILAKYKKG